MTPTKDAALMANAVPTPDAAMTTPASAGPTARAKLNSMPLSADADARSSWGTSSGKTARQLGLSNASPADRAKVRISNTSGDMSPAMVTTASTMATVAIHTSVNKINFRRSTMSPMDPAGKANTKNGRALAVCVRATYRGPAWREIISQAAPTLCINVPMSEATSATSRLRKIGPRRGRHRVGTSLESWPATLNGVLLLTGLFSNKVTRFVKSHGILIVYVQRTGVAGSGRVQF